MNIYSVVLELAKQELIQKPYFMVCSWSKVMHKLRSFPEFCCFDAVHQYYSSANPTNKAVISLLDVEPKSDAERDCLRFLQRYIRGLDKSQLIKFLRFTTGSDIIAVDKITVDFIKVMECNVDQLGKHVGPSWNYLTTTKTFASCEKNSKMY